MSTDCHSIPAVYYVIQGRALNNDSDYIEQYFMDLNPLKARKKAFSHLEYYVQLLQDGEKIFFSENDKIVTTEVKLENIQNYKVRFAEDNVGIDGLALYMVINKPTTIEGKTDNKEDRYLIFSVKNLDSECIEKIKYSLIREYLYYIYFNLKYTSEFIEEITLLKMNNKNGLVNKRRKFRILKTPFDFLNSDFQTKSKQRRFELIRKDINKNNKLKTVFISNLNFHAIRIEIASLLNTKGGKIFFCHFKQGQVLSVFENQSINSINTTIRREIAYCFKSFNGHFKLNYIKINKILVPIIEIDNSYFTPCFYGNEESNNFYYRSENGLEVLKQTEQIVKYISKKQEEYKKSIQSILDIL